ncbi:MAG: M48 family metallopeptidase [Elusimicrobiaceae bacterium]|nr:M48 family metallopeptidase [Elusimicrobiaceae bacterium]
MINAQTDINTTISEVQLFIEQLKKDLPEVFAKENKTTGCQAGPGEKKILFKGILHDYKLVRDPESAPEVVISENCIRVHTGSAAGNAPVALLENWMRRTAEDTLAARVAYWSELMGVTYNRVTVKDQKTLWGSCSEKSNLNFSWRVIKAPESVLDYLVIHELAHLKHLNHKTEFWQFVEQFCPDYKNRRRWLHEYKDSLFTELPTTDL